MYKTQILSHFEINPYCGNLIHETVSKRLFQMCRNLGSEGTNKNIEQCTHKRKPKKHLQKSAS